MSLKIDELNGSTISYRLLSPYQEKHLLADSSSFPQFNIIAGKKMTKILAGFSKNAENKAGKPFAKIFLQLN